MALLGAAVVPTLRPHGQGLLVGATDSGLLRQGSSGFGSVLIDLDFELPRLHRELKTRDGAQHRLRIALGQIAPLLGIAGLVVANELLEELVFMLGLLEQPHPHLRVQNHIIPRGHALYIGVHRGRHIGLRAHHCDHRLWARVGLHLGLRVRLHLRSQQPAMRVGIGEVPQQAPILRR
jgi:hypothetical protein